MPDKHPVPVGAEHRYPFFVVVGELGLYFCRQRTHKAVVHHVKDIGLRPVSLKPFLPSSDSRAPHALAPPRRSLHRSPVTIIRGG